MPSSHAQFEVDGPQRDGTFPTEVVHEVNSPGIEVQCSKTSRSSKSSLKKKSVNKMKFANRGVRCSQQNSEVQVHQICQENWHPV